MRCSLPLCRHLMDCSRGRLRGNNLPFITKSIKRNESSIKIGANPRINLWQGISQLYLVINLMKFGHVDEMVALGQEVTGVRGGGRQGRQVKRPVRSTTCHHRASGETARWWWPPSWFSRVWRSLARVFFSTLHVLPGLSDDAPPKPSPAAFYHFTRPL